MKKAIDSVIEQSYTDFELLVIDDFSTDDTRDIVLNYGDARIKYYLNEKTKGAQGARNTGLYHAKGEWVAMLDSDDVWLPNKLELVVSKIENENSGDLVGVGSNYITYDFDKDEIIKVTKSYKNKVTTNDLLYRNYLGGFSTFVFNRQAGIKIDGFDENFPALQDMDFYILLSKIGQIHILDKELVYLRVCNDDRISTNFKIKSQGAEMLERKHYDLIKKRLKLRCRAKSRVNVFSMKAGKPIGIDFLKWYTISLFFDFGSFKWITKNVLRNSWK